MENREVTKREAAEVFLQGRPFREGVRSFKRAALRSYLAQFHGNQSMAARAAGLHRNSFARIAFACGLDLPAESLKLRERRYRIPSVPFPKMRKQEPEETIENRENT